MKLKHKICIKVTDDTGRKQRVLSGTSRRLPSKLLKALFGDNTEVLILSPGQSVETVEIHEIERGDDNDTYGNAQTDRL